MIVKGIRKVKKINLEGGSLADIDLDFSSDGRPKVVDYIRERFGEEQVVSAGTFGMIKIKSAIQALGMVHGVEPKVRDIVSKCVDDGDSSFADLFRRACEEPKLKSFIESYPQVVWEMPRVLGQPRSRGVHACAMMCYPIEKTSRQWSPISKVGGVVVSEFEGTELDESGFLKLDILATKQLSKFQDIIKRVRGNGKGDVDIYNIPYDEQGVFDMMGEGMTIDCFQIGSQGIQNYIRKLKPKTIDDVVATVALYRPGAMNNGYHEAYIRRANGEEDVTYPYGTEEILSNTYGLMVYQEQIANIFIKLANFTPLEADNVRKILGKKLVDKVEALRGEFVDGAIGNGCDSREAESMFNSTTEFAKYSFNKCVSGDTKFHRNNIRKGASNPTIGDMYKIRHDLEYAKSVGKTPLRGKYKRLGYGKALSLNDDGKLRPNNIVDIRYEGVRPVYRITTESGASIKTTSNHKFPTKNGLKLCEELIVGEDELYLNDGYISLSDAKTRFEIITSIEYVGDEDVYDVEMEAPSHTFLVDSGIVTCNSHSASYAETAYISQYLKHHYPSEFYATALTMMDDKEIPRVLDEINMNDSINVVPLDINNSQSSVTENGRELIWALTSIKGLGDKSGGQIVADRANNPYKSLFDFISRNLFKGSKVNKGHIESLILCGAFDKLEGVKYPANRLKLIDYYRSGFKKKIKDDGITSMKDSLDPNLEVLLFQLEKSGLDSIPYGEYSVEVSDREYLTNDKLSIEYHKAKSGVVLGVLDKVIESKTKKGDRIASIIIKNNYTEHRVRMWADEYKEHKDSLSAKTGRLVGIEVVVKYDAKWGSPNQLVCDGKLKVF